MQLKSSFIKNILACYSQEGEIWLENLDKHLESLAFEWNFKFLHPVPDLSYNFVAVVQLQTGPAILKTGPSAARLMVEAEWLKAHKNRAPAIVHLSQEKNAFLMEKLEPGRSLKYLVKEGRDEEATAILAQVILDLQSCDVLHQADYQPIADHLASFSFLQGHLDAKILEQAKAIYRDLCLDSSNNIILHGDLHHDNILQKGASWYVIDPQGYIGDPCAEIGPLIYNLWDSFPKSSAIKNIIERRLAILNEILPFGLERIKAWAFCLALRSAAWDVEGFGSPDAQTIEIAKIINSCGC